jgi:hypothetical protein
MAQNNQPMGFSGRREPTTAPTKEKATTLTVCAGHGSGMRMLR